MARLKTVEVIPSTRSLTSAWHADPALDGFLGASRGVFECLSDAVREADVPNRRSTARFYVHKADDEQLRIDVAERHDPDIDEGNIHIPTGFAGAASASERISWAFDVAFACVSALAVREGWAEGALEVVRESVVSSGLRFVHEGKWRSSPDRRHEACGRYFLDDEGLGHVQLLVRTRREQEIVLRSPAAEAFMTREGMVRSAATVTWESGDRVGLVPWVDLAGREAGWLDADLSDACVADDAAPQPVRPLEPLPVAVRYVAPRALVHMTAADRQAAELWLQAGGYILLQRGRTARVLRLWEQVVSGLRDEVDGRAWLADSPFVNVQVQLATGSSESDLAGTERFETAVGTELLTSLVVDVERLNALADQDLVRELDAALQRHLRAVARRRKLPEPPLAHSGDSSA